VLRQLIRVSGEIAATAYENEGRTATELVDDAERRVFEIAEQGKRSGSGFVALRDVLGATIDRLDLLHQTQGHLTGVSTGYNDLDRMTAGLQPGDLVIIAGRPSMGKTTLALNIAECAAISHNVPVAVFSMEMSREQLAFRMISSLGRVDQSHLRTGMFGDEDWARINSAIAQMRSAPIYIDDSGALTPTEVRARARRLKRERGLGLIVIDYLQLMQVPGTKENRATEISEISRSIKALARELQVPVIALSQLNRGVEQRTDKKPVMSDLRESGALEQDSDLIMLIYREEVYEPDTPRKGIADIIIAKQRNGPTGEVHLTFLGKYTRFENLASGAYGHQP
jgi:replicative DNA helicase